MCIHKIYIFIVTSTQDSHFYYMYYIYTKFTFLLFQIHFDTSWVTFLPQYLICTLWVWGFHIFCFVFKYAFLKHLFHLSLFIYIYVYIYLRVGLKYHHIDCVVENDIFIYECELVTDFFMYDYAFVINLLLMCTWCLFTNEALKILSECNKHWNSFS